MTAVNFFLGANTPQGFVSYLPTCYAPQEGWRVYLIKSGPGTGKSTLMRRVLETMEAQGEEAEAILCSGDPHSLDGVRFPRLKAAVLDATAPHPVEPRYWGACETIVDLGAGIDTGRLRENAPALRAATDACTARHARCRDILATAEALLADSRRTALACTDTDKVRRTAARLAEREFAGGESGGAEERRFLSAVTPQGILTLYGTMQALCPRILIIEDEYGAAGGLLLEQLRQQARERGLAAIVCPCPLAPQEKVDHLLFPTLGLGFTLSSPWHKADFPALRRLHAARFTDEESLREKRARLTFNRKAARELLEEAVKATCEAKTFHDEMERFNREAMDFSVADRLCEKVTGELTALAAACPR